MDRASSGITFVANKNLIGFSDTQLTKFRQENIGYIFQQYGLLPNLNVKENIEVGAFLQRDASKRKDIDELLKTLGCTNNVISCLLNFQGTTTKECRLLEQSPKINCDLWR